MKNIVVKELGRVRGADRSGVGASVLLPGKSHCCTAERPPGVSGRPKRLRRLSRPLSAQKRPPIDSGEASVAVPADLSQIAPVGSPFSGATVASCARDPRSPLSLSLSRLAGLRVESRTVQTRVPLRRHLPLSPRARVILIKSINKSRRSAVSARSHLKGGFVRAGLSGAVYGRDRVIRRRQKGA